MLSQTLPATGTPARRSFSHHQLGSSRRAVRFSSVQRMIFKHASEPSPEVGLQTPKLGCPGRGGVGWTCGNRRLLLLDDKLFQLPNNTHLGKEYAHSHIDPAPLYLAPSSLPTTLPLFPPALPLHPQEHCHSYAPKSRTTALGSTKSFLERKKLKTPNLAWLLTPHNSGSAPKPELQNA